MRSLVRAVTVSAALLCAGASALALADDGAIKTISRGKRADALKAMTYKPFDAALWSKLEGWSGGTAATKESTAGKPVLIVAWASWYKTSYAALTQAQKAADTTSDLVVVGVHHNNGFDKAPAAAKDLGIKFPIAHDSKKGFFEALKIEAAGPHFYIVDRAGNLRFADVDKSSLAEAVTIVADETADAASKAEGRAKESRQAAGETPIAGPEVKGRPDAAAYKAAAWPKHESASRLHAKNVQGKKLPVALGNETWISEKPDMDGKVVVLDFWATWCPPCVAISPTLDQMQSRNKDNLVIIGMSGQARGPSKEDVPSIKKYVQQHKVSYYHANDVKRNIHGSLGIEGIPHVVVISSDGVVRWQGNPHSQDFVSVVDKVIAADPWVKARSKGKS